MVKLIVRNLFAVILLAVASAGALVGYTWYFFIHINGGRGEAVAFASSDGARLQGTLFLPDGPGPHPAIIILHGSGPASGAPIFVTGHANAFLKHGIAVLVYDKRGCGKSEGDFDTATYKDFINDAVAGVSYLRSRTDIATDKVALFGSSESGWLTPEISDRAGEIAFIINRAGPPLPWIETNLWEVRNELIDAGLTDETKTAEFLSLRERIWRYYEEAADARDPLPERRRELERALAAIDPDWLKASGMRIAGYDQETFERFLVDILYDPTPYWRRLEMPVLAIHGSADQNVPTARAVEAYKTFRRENGVRVDLVVYPGYRHGLGKYQNLFSMGYPPDYLPRVGAFAAEHFR